MKNPKLVLQKNLRWIREQKIVLAAGCYDILSFAHIRHLEWAKQQGNILVVGITSDAHVTRHKGEGRPHYSHSHRAEVVSGLNCVDHVVICRANSTLPIIKELRPHIYVKGADTINNPSDHFQAEVSYIKSYGGVVLFSPADEQAHTSDLLKGEK